MNANSTIFRRRRLPSPGYRSSVFAALLGALSNSAAADKVSLSPMTVYEDIDYPELIDSPRMNNQLNREALQAGEMPNLNGALRTQGGLMLNQGSGQMPTGISLRGAAGGQGLLTLDGVPLFGNFAGFYSLSHYSLDALDKLTVNRGSGGERHGSRNLGGAIHLKTRHLQDKENFFRFEGGSYDTVRGTAGGGLATEAGDFSVVVGRNDIFSGLNQATRGSERDNFSMTHVSGNWFKEFEPGSLDASLYFVRTDEGIDGPGVLLPERKVHWLDDNRGRFGDETWVAQLRGKYELSDQWTGSLQFGYTQDRQKMQTRLVAPFALTNQLFMVDWKNTHRYPLGKDNHALLIWGVNSQHQQTLNTPVRQTVISPNLRAELSLGPWQWSADTRLDHGSPYGDHQVFTLAVNRELPMNMSVWANGGTGYRQPGVSELAHPVFGNAGLQGEHSAGGEIGWRWRPQTDSEIKVSGYFQNYRQLIIMMLNSQTGISRAGNVPQADIWGAELQARHRWTSRWQSGLNYSYMHAINPINHSYVPNRPEHQGVLWNEINLTQPLSFRLELSVQDAYWYDFRNTLRAPTMPRINTALNYRLSPKTDIYLRGINITDERSSQIYDFNFTGAAFYLGVRTGF